jgi:hypothetical protein
MKTLREIFLETIDAESTEIFKNNESTENAAFSNFKEDLIYGFPSKDKIKTLESVGGEDQGSYAHIVFEYEGVIYKAEASYDSYDGMNTDYMQDSLKVVNPVQKTITVWE